MPYLYLFSTNAKERWFNRTLLEVFSTEYRIGSVEHLQRNIARDRVHGTIEFWV